MGAALGDGEQAVHGDIFQDIGPTTDPADLNAVDPCPLAQAEVWVHPVVALVAASTVHFVNLGQVAGDHLDPSADAVPIAPSSAQADSNPMVGGTTTCFFKMTANAAATASLYAVPP